MVEKYIKSNMCVLPWTHLEVDVNGSASPCCLYKGEIVANVIKDDVVFPKGVVSENEIAEDVIERIVEDQTGSTID